MKPTNANRFTKRKYFFLWRELSSRGQKSLSSKDKDCRNCGKIGHFRRVCQSQTRKTVALSNDGVRDTHNKKNDIFAQTQETGASYLYPILATAPTCLNRTTLVSLIGGKKFDCLLDVGAS